MPVRRVAGPGAVDEQDLLAVEEPLEIRVAFGPDTARSARSLAITMRTPGHDFELAAGFLFTEQIVKHPDEIRSIEFCGPPAPGRAESNIVRVELAPEVALDLARLERHFYATSSCGICGKASLDALEVRGLEALGPGPRFARAVIHELPERLRAMQPVFGRTGGLHAAGLADTAGAISEVREDVGRHNAVDKLLGHGFLAGRTPLSDRALVVSGRASFEILQKALVAGLPLLVAVGAPSSLAVELAARFGMTVIGFAGRERFNVYCGHDRVADA